MKRNTSIAALLAAATIATTGGLAYAGQDGKRAGDRYDELLTSKITLQHAIADQLSELRLAYPVSPLTARNGHAGYGPKPGMRWPSPSSTVAC